MSQLYICFYQIYFVTTVYIDSIRILRHKNIFFSFSFIVFLFFSIKSLSLSLIKSSWIWKNCVTIFFSFQKLPSRFKKKYQKKIDSCFIKIFFSFGDFFSLLSTHEDYHSLSNQFRYLALEYRIYTNYTQVFQKQLCNFLIYI
jgi:hypothetical protein